MEKNKIWKGRIESPTDIAAEKFTRSIPVDWQLYSQDITGTAAYAAGLENIGIITSAELAQILEGLKKIKEKIESGNANFDDYEDIHSFVEYELLKISGEPAKKVHTGRSRNDQIVTDELLMLKKAIIDILRAIYSILDTILKKAQENIETVFPAYTHMQKAQPVLVSHYLLSYFNKFLRVSHKFLGCFEDCDFLPLGAGACSGSGYSVNTKLLAELLKFKRTGKNSMDIVSSRDYIIDFIYCCSMAMLGLSRFCEDLIIYNTYEFSFINIDDSFCTGSSIMPQKKNPDILELIRGKSALVTGNLMQVFMLLKGLPSTYNSDMQEDKKIFFNSYRETIDSLVIFNRILEKIEFNGRNIADSTSSGFMEATDAADYLVKKGESFRNAHNIIGRLVKYCIDNDIKLQDMAIDKLQEYSKYFDAGFYSSITVSSSIAAKSTACGTSTASVKKMLASDRKTAEKLLKEINNASERIPGLDEILSGLVKITL